MSERPAPLRPELLPLAPDLRGDQVVLRPYRPGDGAALFAAIDAHREDLKTWLGWIDNHRSEADSEVYVRRLAGRWLTRESLVLGIWTHAGEYCGGTGFHAFDWNVPSFELGYFLHPVARGRGAATEAVRLVTNWAFAALGARRVWASCDRANERSWRLLERCGFRREGHLVNERLDPQGRLRDTLVYAITR